MTGLPQSVRDRLAAQQQAASSHPDADMLNAFVEDALTAGERNTVLEHLARCPTCREVVAISGSLPQETAEAPRPVAPVAWRWNWAVLRWAAPLAAVVVVGAAVLLREDTHRPEPYSPMARQADVRSEPGILKQQETGTEKPEPTVPSESAAAKDASPLERRSAPSKKEAEEYGLVAKKKSDSPVQERKSESIATTSPEGGALSSQSVPSYDKVVPAPPASVDVDREQATVTGTPTREDQDFRARQSVEVQSAAAPAAQKEAAKPQAVGQASAANVAAAPSPRRNGTFPAGNASNNYVLSDTIALRTFAVDWRISNGQLSKTYDRKVWHDQELPGNPKITAVAVVGPHVWAGGKNGVLMHSVNNGETWAQIQLGNPATQEDIREIHFTNITFGIVMTSSGAKWTTNDAGQNWSRD